jgi:NAD(P)-dependent dehydrogenase (short-subunit alcohol dehydrogenase family)
MSGRLAGRCAIVTGGMRGIGRAIAVTLASEGAHVGVVDLDPPDTAAVTELMQEIQATGSRGCYERCDVTRRDQVEAAFGTIVATLGKLNILVNNAGKGRDPVPIDQLQEKDWDEVVALNLKSAYLCCSVAVPHLKKEPGSKIVNLSSTAGRGISPDSIVSYASAKAGVVGFTRQLARELGKFGITVNAIAPGAILSGRAAERFAEGAEDKIRRMVDPIPLARMGKPEEVATVALFLVSSDSSFVTGNTIDVNGGKSMMS